MTCNETIDSIIAEMREFADTDSQDIGRDVLRRQIQHFADRFEAAHKREREATCEKSSVVGNNAAERETVDIENRAIYGEVREAVTDCNQLNAAKMREALEVALRTIRGIIDGKIVFDCRDQLKAALAAPPRNCDIGTAEEQLKRFKDFCRIISKDETCDGCPLLPQCSTLEHCTLKWAQMPYEEVANDGK